MGGDLATTGRGHQARLVSLVSVIRPVPSRHTTSSFLEMIGVKSDILLELIIAFSSAGGYWFLRRSRYNWNTRSLWAQQRPPRTEKRKKKRRSMLNFCWADPVRLPSLKTHDTNLTVTKLASLKTQDTNLTVTKLASLKTHDTNLTVTKLASLKTHDTNLTVTKLASLKTHDTNLTVTKLASLKTEVSGLQR